MYPKKKLKDDLTPYLGSKLIDFIETHSVKHRVRTPDSDWYTSKPTALIERQGFRKVTKPMHVFKKVNLKKNGAAAVIANLIIPVGALFYCDSELFYWQLSNSSWFGPSRKMRASEAKVVSLVKARSQESVQLARSSYDSSFTYEPGQIVKPVDKFSREEDECSSGIHFFINLGDALDY
jgi:hypothetical protein